MRIAHLSTAPDGAPRSPIPLDERLELVPVAARFLLCRLEAENLAKKSRRRYGAVLWEKAKLSRDELGKSSRDEPG